jgi:hypothetical protein
LHLPALELQREALAALSSVETDTKIDVLAELVRHALPLRKWGRQEWWVMSHRAEVGKKRKILLFCFQRRFPSYLALLALEYEVYVVCTQFFG